VTASATRQRCGTIYSDRTERSSRVTGVTGRRRLEPQERREQLVDIGAAMFAEKPYEDVYVEDIAARADVSRALMYRYFPTKRDLYIAILKRASGRFLARLSPDPQRPLAEQLVDGLEVHIQSFVDHPFEAIAINRGALSNDPAIQAIIAEELNVVGQRLVDQLVAEGRPRDVIEIAVEGWLAFVRAACVKWIQSQNISRADLADICLSALDCTLGYPPSRSRGRYLGYVNDRSLRIGPPRSSVVDRWVSVAAEAGRRLAAPGPNVRRWL